MSVCQSVKKMKSWCYHGCSVDRERSYQLLRNTLKHFSSNSNLSSLLVFMYPTCWKRSRRSDKANLLGEGSHFIRWKQEIKSEQSYSKTQLWCVKLAAPEMPETWLCRLKTELFNFCAEGRELSAKRFGRFTVHELAETTSCYLRCDTATSISGHLQCVWLWVGEWI